MFKLYSFTNIILIEIMIFGVTNDVETIIFRNNIVRILRVSEQTISISIRNLSFSRTIRRDETTV